MRAFDAEIIAIDFEGTGVVGEFPSEPWQIGMVTLSGGQVAMERCYESLLRTGDRPFNPYAPGLHHQLREQIAAAPTLAELWPAMQQWWLGRPLAAHNAGTERAFMAQVAPMHTFGPWIDTLPLARHVYPQLQSHTLEDLLDHLRLMHRVVELCPDRLPHDALFDAVGCAVLLRHFLSLPGWEQVTVEALANARSTDYHRQVAARTRRPGR